MLVYCVSFVQACPQKQKTIRSSFLVRFSEVSRDGHRPPTTGGMGRQKRVASTSCAGTGARLSWPLPATRAIDAATRRAAAVTVCEQHGPVVAKFWRYRRRPTRSPDRRTLITSPPTETPTRTWQEIITFTANTAANLARMLLFLELALWRTSSRVASAAPRTVGGRWREEGIAFNSAERHQRTRRAARNHARQNLQHVRRPAGFGTALPLGCSQPARPDAARCGCLRESAAVEEVVRTTNVATAMMAAARHKG